MARNSLVVVLQQQESESELGSEGEDAYSQINLITAR
jgi:hypothetical protein